MSEEEIEDWKRAFENPEVIYLSQQDYDAIVAHLEEDPQPNQSLIDLFKGKYIWD